MTINATAVWRVRPSGNNSNGGGYDAGISGAATDYSQQNSAQATGTNGTGTSATFTDAVAAAFTSAMVGNAMYVTGGGATAGWYFVTGFTSSHVVTLDRSPGTYTNATWNLGGAWLDPQTNFTSSGPLVPGNTVYIRGGGTDNPSTADYTVSSFAIVVGGNSTAGIIRFIGENGRPMIVASSTLWLYECSYNWFENFYLQAGGTAQAGLGLISTYNGGGGPIYAVNCVFDQNGNDTTLLNGDNGITGVGPVIAIGCEVFNSGSSSTATKAAVVAGQYGSKIIGCNIHNCNGDGISLANDISNVIGNVIAANGGNGITVASFASTDFSMLIQGNTIDGNAGHGIQIAPGNLGNMTCLSNLITNHTGASKSGIAVTSGTAAVNNLLSPVFDFNWYYNNTSDLTGLGYGSHDTHGTSPGYNSRSTQDYTLPNGAAALNKGYPSAASPSLPIGASPAFGATLQQYFLRRSQTPNVEDYNSPGAVQSQQGGGGGGASMLVHPGMTGGARG